MKGRDAQGNIRLFLIEWKYTESYPSKREKKSGSRRDNRLWRYRSFFTRDGSPFTFCNSDVGSTFFEELLTEPYYQLMRQTLLGWKMTQDPSRNGQATSFTHIVSSSTATRPSFWLCGHRRDGRGMLGRGMDAACPGPVLLPCARRVAATVDGAAGLRPPAGLSLSALLAGRAVPFVTHCFSFQTIRHEKRTALAGRPCRLRYRTAALQAGSHLAQQAGQLVGEAGFVVVPDDELGHGAVHDLGGQGVHDAAVGAALEVDGDQGLVAVAHIVVQGAVMGRP